MNAKDLTEFYSLVEQFQSEMTLKEICSQPLGDALSAGRLRRHSSSA